MDNLSNDMKIEKMLVDLKEHSKENDRLIAICKGMIEEYKMQIENYEKAKQDKIDYTLSQISGLLEDIDMKETKTQKSYKVPNGQIIIKKAEQNIKLIKGADLGVVPEEFIKIEKSVNWMELKKELIIDGKNIINKNTGEVVDYCVIEEKKEELKIRL